MKKNKLNIKNLVVNKIAIRLLAGGITLGCAYAASKTNQNIPIKISDEVYNSITHNNVFEKFNFNKYYLLHADDSDNNYRDNIIDEALTKEKLEHTKNLNIDVLKTDFNDLKLMPNIENITFSNFGYLTADEKQILSSLEHIQEVIIKYDDSLFNENTCDLSWLNKDIKVKFIIDNYIIKSYYDELQKIYYYNFLSDTLSKLTSNNKNRTITHNIKNIELYNQLEKWDTKLTDIVKSFNFNEDTTEEEKIYKIIDYVTNSLEYDPDIKKKIRENKSAYKKVLDYNLHSLSSYLGDDSEYGVCTNYATLTSIIGYYSDVDLKLVHGTHNGNGHAWCQYDDGKNIYIIDPTFLDDDIYRSLRNKYENDKTDINRKNLFDEVFTLNDESYYHKENGVVDSNTYFKNTAILEKNVEYINKKLDRYINEVVNKKNLIYLIATLTALSIFACNEAYIIKENKTKKLKKYDLKQNQ